MVVTDRVAAAMGRLLWSLLLWLMGSLLVVTAQGKSRYIMMASVLFSQSTSSFSAFSIYTDVICAVFSVYVFFLPSVY